MVKKKVNVILWIFSILLLSFAVINQKIVHYDHIFPQFIITFSLSLVGVLIAIKKTNQGTKLKDYLSGSLVELKQVTWPTKKETIQTTIAVVTMVIVMGLILWSADAILIRLVAWLLERGVS